MVEDTKKVHIVVSKETRRELNTLASMKDMSVDSVIRLMLKSFKG